MLSKESLKDLYIIISDLNDGGEQYWGSSKDFELEAEIFFELKKQLSAKELKEFLKGERIFKAGDKEYLEDFFKETTQVPVGKELINTFKKLYNETSSVLAKEIIEVFIKKCDFETSTEELKNDVVFNLNYIRENAYYSLDFVLEHITSIVYIISDNPIYIRIKDDEICYVSNLLRDLYVQALAIIGEQILSDIEMELDYKKDIKQRCLSRFY